MVLGNSQMWFACTGANITAKQTWCREFTNTSPSGETHKVAGLGIAWLGDARIERQWQVGIHCPALEGDRQGGPSLRQPFQTCTIKPRVVGKGVTVFSAASVFPKAI